MGRYDALFTPMKIGSLEVKNRIVLGAMGIHTHRLLNDDGSFAEDGIVILSRLVDTFFSRILYPMLPLSGNHSIAVV